MDLRKKIKKELINKYGYDFDSEYWTDENIDMFEEIMKAAENVVKELINNDESK